MKYRIEKIDEYNQISVSPNWYWNDQYGDSIIVDGVTEIAKNDRSIQDSIRTLLQQKIGEFVTLANPKRIISGSLVCDVITKRGLLREEFLKNQDTNGIQPKT